jgi:hypothetical protein
MSTNGSENTIAPIEIDMRDVLQAKRLRSLTENKGAVNDFSGIISQISGPSLQEIGQLVEGLASELDPLFQTGRLFFPPG